MREGLAEPAPKETRFQHSFKRGDDMAELVFNSILGRPRFERREDLTEVTSSSDRSQLNWKNSDMPELILSRLRWERMDDMVESAVSSRVRRTGSSETK